MRSMIALIALLSSTAFADDTSPSKAARTEYRTELTELLSTNQEAERSALSACEEAKSAYRAAEGELSRINTELEATGNEAIGDLRANYVRTLEGLKAKEDAKLEQAKSSAKQAGVELSEVRGNIEAIEAEIARIDEQVQRERETRNPPQSAFGRSTLNSDLTGGLGGLDSRARTSYGYGSAPKPPALPAEFKTCFPSEVSPGS